MIKNVSAKNRDVYMKPVCIFSKKLIVVVLLLISGIDLSAQRATSAHVILISIDGLRPEFYLDKKWPAPNIRELKDRGVYANGIHSVFPSVTYPSHTSIITGANPGKHGVYYNAPVGSKNGAWYWESSYIRVPTLWDAVRDAGKTSGSVMWPVSVGAPVNYNFPVKRADENESGNQLEITRPLITPANLLDQLENETGRLSGADFNTSNTIDITIGKMSAGIFKKYKPNLLTIHFVTADHLQHELGREGPGVQHSVALIDSMIGVIMRTVKEAGLERTTTFIITGDHGFVNTDYNFSPNVLLEKHGLHRQESGLFFQSTGGSSFLYASASGKDSGVTTVKKLLSNLSVDERKAFRLIDRDELDKAGVNPEVVLALSMNNGYAANNAAKGAIITKKKHGGTHGHFPDFAEISTGFVAAGAGISGSGRVGGDGKEILMGVIDIAPLVAHLLGLSFRAPDGRLITGIID
ncbi:MAG: alkaline phosphatase family protein [Chitinophagaceae bacterium]|nr:MAG: alkaline phosphatase family protein [Chitinophagaceae bacterium]